MGKRGPKPGDYAGKVKVLVPVHKPGIKEYFVPRYVSPQIAAQYKQYVEKPKDFISLEPENPNRLHSHHGALKHHPVSMQHENDMVNIEHRDEIDNYDQEYYGRRQIPWHEKLKVSVRDIPIRIRNIPLKAERYSRSDIGKLYVFEYNMHSYVLSPSLGIFEVFKTTDLTPARKFVENYFSRDVSKSILLKDINAILEKPLMPEKVNAFASYTSGNNSVMMEYDGKTYSILVNGSPVYQSGEFGSAMSEYYRQIGEIVRLQESDPDIALDIFGDQVVRTNRNAIEKLSMMGKSMEADMLKNFDYSDLSLNDVFIRKFEPPSNQIGQVPVMEDMGQGANEIRVKPRRLEREDILKIDKHDKVGVEEAKAIAEKIGIDFNKYNLSQFVKGINVEMEHGSKDPQTNVIGDDKVAAGKIALAHLKEVPDYYTRLEIVEKELKDLGIRPAPEEALQDRHRDIERPFKAKDDHQIINTPSEEAPIMQKDFPKQVEGDTAHEQVGLENKDTIGRKPKPIIGKSFSPMMANTRIGEDQKAIDGMDGIGSFSTEEQTTAEENNQMQELSNYGDVVHNRKPFFDMIKSDIIYDQIDDILKASSLIEGQQPSGVKSLGNEIERNIYYGLRDIVNNWYSKVDNSTSLDKAVLDLKADLLKWQIESNKNVTADVKDIFNKGIEAGIRNTGVAVPDRLMGTFNYQIYKPTGISPALENFQNEIFGNISKILNKHYVQKSGFPLYRTKRDIDSYLRKARYKTRLMFKSEVASMANLGQIIAWDQDPEKYKYEYHWNAILDDRIKPISKMRAEGNPYSLPEISFLWKNQIQSINGKFENDEFNQRCSISRGSMLDKEWQYNRFNGKEHLYKSTMI